VKDNWNNTEQNKQNYPDQYKASAGYLMENLIRDALIDGNKMEAGNLFLKFAENPDFGIDYFNEISDHMAYYGDLDLVLEAMRKGW
jgi:hypothetical protein